MVAHYFNIKIYANESILNTVRSLEGIFQFLTTEFTIVILVHGINEFDDLELWRNVTLTHMKERVLNQFFDFSSVQQVVMICIVFFEYVVHCLLNLISGISQFMIFFICLVLHKFAIEGRKRFFVLAKRRTGSLWVGRNRSQVWHVLGLESYELSGVGRELFVFSRTLLFLLCVRRFNLSFIAGWLHPKVQSDISNIIYPRQYRSISSN